MTRICAWCGKYLGEIRPDQIGVTHGICPTCAAKMLQQRLDKRVKKV